MKLMICGSRSLDTAKVIPFALSWFEIFPYRITEIVQGEARGIDTLAKNYAISKNIPTKGFPAEWDKYGKSAGYRRNVEMVDYADEVLAIWDGKSKGTRHSIDITREKGKPLYTLKIQSFVTK